MHLRPCAWSRATMSRSGVGSGPDIGRAMDPANPCVEAVERLDSDHLPRLSSMRESQLGKAKKSYDYCKEVLTYKKDKGLCK